MASLYIALYRLLNNVLLTQNIRRLKRAYRHIQPT
jgi:hypothetical protein